MIARDDFAPHISVAFFFLDFRDDLAHHMYVLLQFEFVHQSLWKLPVYRFNKNFNKNKQILHVISSNIRLGILF